MKKFLKGISFLLITALILSLTSCGIPNYSPINCLSTSKITSDYSSSSYNYTDSYIDVTGDAVSDETLYNDLIQFRYPRICFFYTIAPKDVSYLSTLVSNFNSQYVSDKNLVQYSLHSDRKFVTTTITLNDKKTEVSLYQFTLDQNNSANSESYIFGTDSYQNISGTKLRSYLNFNLNQETKNLDLIITDPTTNTAKTISLNRYNRSSFTTNENLEGSDYINNEVPAEYSNENLVLYIYYSVEVGFSTYNNFPHTSLRLFKEIDL